MKVETIKGGAIIDIKIGNQFLQDLQYVTVFLGMMQPPESTAEILKKAESADFNPDDLNDWERAIYIMLILITNIEKNAQEQGWTIVEDIPESEISPESPE
jgi:hypothetical protein